MFLDDCLPFSGVCHGFTQKFTLDGSELKALIGEKDVNCEISANQNPVSVSKSADFYVILKNIIDRVWSQWFFFFLMIYWHYIPISQFALSRVKTGR